MSLQQDSNNFIASLPIMYGAGLLTSVSPCVWSLLPLTLSYISTAAGERKDGNASIPTLVFAAGLAVVFCSLGVAAAELGGVFGGTNSNSLVGLLLRILSNGICLVMGLQLLELVDLPLLSLDLRPKNRMDAAAKPVLIDGTGQILATTEDGEQSRSLFRTFLLGGSSALVASPCATPVLSSILGFVASSQNSVLGFLLLLGYTLGFSTPLLFVAATGGQALARLRQSEGDGLYARIIGPWVTPLTAGILLWYGTNGMLTTVLGDPSLVALAPVIE